MIEWNKQVKKIIEVAHTEAKEMGNNYVGSEHVLLSIMKDTKTSLHKILAKQGIYYFQLKEDLMVLFGLRDSEIEEVRLTAVVDDILNRCEEKCLQQSKKEVDEKILSRTLLETSNCVANEILHRYHADISSLLEDGVKSGIYQLDQIKELRYLNTCGRNTDIVGRETELELMMLILSRKEKANPLLVGDAGVGKTAMVERLAYMIENKEVNEDLQNIKLYELHLNTLVAGTKYRGDFEEKLQKIINLCEEHSEVVLFIDEIHQMIGAGKSEGSIDVSSVLKPYLARDTIRLIGATTFEEYENYMEKDRALGRRFQIVKLEEPTKQMTYEMLKLKRKEFESYHHVEFGEEYLYDMINLCEKYLPEKKFPDKAIDLLDLACAETKRKNRVSVTQDEIYKVAQDITGIPLTNQQRIGDCLTSIHKKIIGHEYVLHQLYEQLHQIEEHEICEKPKAVWLFVGNEGVGKTYFLKMLNKEYFKQKDMHVFDFKRIETNFERNLERIHRNPTGLIVFKNIENISDTHTFFYQMMEEGKIDYKNKSYDIRHCILVICVKETFSNRINFNKEKVCNQYLDKEIMKYVDETFYFRELSEKDKICIIRKLLKDEDEMIDETSIIEAIQSTSSLRFATNKLKIKKCKNLYSNSL